METTKEDGNQDTAAPIVTEQCFCRGGEARPTCVSRCRRFRPSVPGVVSLNVVR